MLHVGSNLRLRDLGAIERAGSTPVAFWQPIAESLFDRPGLVERVANLGVPISLHSVGMNLAGLDPTRPTYLDRIAELIAQLRPGPALRVMEAGVLADLPLGPSRSQTWRR